MENFVKEKRKTINQNKRNDTEWNSWSKWVKERRKRECRGSDAPMEDEWGSPSFVMRRDRPDRWVGDHDEWWMRSRRGIETWKSFRSLFCFFFFLEKKRAGTKSSVLSVNIWGAPWLRAAIVTYKPVSGGQCDRGPTKQMAPANAEEP